MTLKGMETLEMTDVRTVDRDSLVDIQDIKIDRGLPVDERIKDFVRKVGNPYCFKVGGIVVKVTFSKDGPGFQEQFEKMLSTIR